MIAPAHKCHCASSSIKLNCVISSFKFMWEIPIRLWYIIHKRLSFLFVFFSLINILKVSIAFFYHSRSHIYCKVTFCRMETTGLPCLELLHNAIIKLLHGILITFLDYRIGGRKYGRIKR